MELFIIDTWEEMEEALRTGDIEVIDAICKVVKKGIKRKFKKVTMFSVILRDDPDYEYDWILENNQYKSMLENCIHVYSEHERYEECAELKKLLDTL